MGTDRPAADSRKSLVRRFFDEVWTRAEFGRVHKFVTPRCVLHYRGKALGAGPEELVRIVGRWKRAFPDLRFDVQDVVAEGNRVAARMVHRGTHRGEWRGIPPTGRTIEVHEMMSFRFEGDRIAEVWEVTDEHAEREQLRESDAA